MRLVFMGTPDFARACLEKLHTDGFDIAAVYTKIDTPKNRGMKDITIKLYPEGRHEMLNERNKSEVYQDVLAWLGR